MIVVINIFFILRAFYPALITSTTQHLEALMSRAWSRSDFGRNACISEKPLTAAAECVGAVHLAPLRTYATNSWSSSATTQGGHTPSSPISDASVSQLQVGHEIVGFMLATPWYFTAVKQRLAREDGVCYVASIEQ